MARAASTNSFGRFHELLLAQRERIRPHDTGVRHPLAHPQDEDEVADPGAQHHQEHDGQEDERERELDVAEAHDQVVHPPPEIPREEPGHDPDPAPDGDGREPDQQGDPRPVEQSGKHVAPEGVGPQPEDRALRARSHRIRQAEHEVLPVGIEGRQHGTEGRRNRRGQEYDQGEDGPARIHHGVSAAFELSSEAHPRASASFTRGSRRT
jgi:hypothetical protein